MILRFVTCLCLTILPFTVAAEDLKIEKGARLFAELCTKDPRTMDQRLTAIITREFRDKGSYIPGKHRISGLGDQAILTFNTPAYKNAKSYECSVHAFGVDSATAVNAWFQAFNRAKPRSYKVAQVARQGRNEMARWTVSGLGQNGALSAIALRRGGAAMILSWD